jgi:hypothetical protein
MRPFDGEGLNQHLCLQDVLSRLDLVAPFHGDDKLVDREAFGTRDRDRHTATVQQKVQMPIGHPCSLRVLVP